MQSDTEEEDDDDPDGLLEADLDKDEMIEPQDVDLAGDEFLRVHYSTSSSTSTAPRKKRVCLTNCSHIQGRLSTLTPWSKVSIPFPSPSPSFPSPPFPSP